MPDHALRRADELLTELVELVETARAVPMSSSCVVGREQTLDLLDALRDVMPVEMAEARRVVAQRDDVLRAAAERDALSRTAAEDLLADAQTQADALLAQARIDADVLLDQGRSEQVRLISATTVHHAASAEANRLQAEAQEYAQTLRAQAQAEADRIVGSANAAAAQFRANSEQYADRTLADLLESLGRIARTAEQGRVALAARRNEPLDTSPSVAFPAAPSGPSSATSRPTPPPPSADVTAAGSAGQGNAAQGNAAQADASAAEVRADGVEAGPGADRDPDATE